ncbi:hypothetical protein GCM10011506_00980 [Marivirga lumbricoides]|uniref:Zinc-finger domain-containing protein n=1 Tax=Marivirga lumbricoides TaxID=1046115 RepID=A0ABQ1L7J8_9BACT|nr:hypothetical protein GCM10011506_00980 [Marivirga lumbricoides]
MSETNYFRLIEAYFDGSIKPEQKLMLESKIETDPLLKAEFNLQQNIINGIGDIRRQQLKARLSSVDVSGSGSMLFGSSVKWLAGTLAMVTIFSTFLYWYMSNLEDRPLELSAENMVSFKEEAFTLPIPTPTVTSDDDALAESTVNNTVKKEDSSEKFNTVAKNVRENRTEKSAKAKPQELVTFKDDINFAPYKDKEFSKTIERDISRNVSAETEIEFLSSVKSDSYHYRYFNNKLYLYGEFENEPYEIIELHNKGHKQLFLSYQNDIYSIKNNMTNITPLQKVEDEMLIMELKLIIDEK